MAFGVAGLAPYTVAPPLGAIAGAVFAGITRKRVLTPGGGLLWGLAFALLLWLAAVFPLALARMGMTNAARVHFQALVGALLLFGAPLGLLLGAFRSWTAAPVRDEGTGFSLLRALTAGGLAGGLSGTAFWRWMEHTGAMTPVGGLIVDKLPGAGSLLHFGVAFVIGSTFGIFFQQDVRGYGSSMGWGLAYGIFWWFLGPLTLLAAVRGHAPDWGVEHAKRLFVLLPAHVLYGLLLGLSTRRSISCGSPSSSRATRSAASRKARLAQRALAGPRSGRRAWRARLRFHPDDCGIDGFPRVATLAGGRRSPWGWRCTCSSGCVGMSYGWLFERESPDFDAGGRLGTALRIDMVVPRAVYLFQMCWGTIHLDA